MNINCIKCKGRGYCGRSYCPHIIKSEARFKVSSKLDKEDFTGSSVSPFVGRFGYPYVNVGILAPPEVKEDAWLLDSPKHWSAENFQIDRIIDFRSSLINSRFTANVKQMDKMLEISQEVGLSSKPVDVEFNLEKKPVFRITADSFMAPTGPNAKLRKATVASNPKIDARVDRVYSDYDFKANEAVWSLYEKGFDENFLSKILSIGTIGVKKDRKLVPTRWSITATDDLIAKNLIKEVKDYSVGNYTAYFGSYLGNYYLVLMFPEVWSYELFEMYSPKASWNVSDSFQFTTDYEDYYGRKNYASNCAGGYYSVRLAVLEKLREMRRQGAVLVLRFITGEYYAPLGVFVTREAARKSLSSKPIEFSSKELMLEYCRKLVRKKFGYNVDSVLGSSLLLKNMKEQRKLSGFIS